MIIDVKLCWFCKHFYYSQADPGYSDATPGSDFRMTCDKRHWDFDTFTTTQEEFGEMLSMAQSCKDFVSIKEIK